MHVLYCALEEDLFRSKHYVSLTFASLSKQIVTTPTYYGITLLSILSTMCLLHKGWIFYIVNLSKLQPL